MTAVGPYSRPHRLRKLDGRTKEAKLLRAVTAQLIAHLGGKATVTEKILVDQCAQLCLRLAQLNDKMASGSLSETDNKVYVCFSNTLSRMMRQLGLDARKAAPPTLDGYIAAKYPKVA